MRVFGGFTRYKLTSLQVTYTSCNDFLGCSFFTPSLENPVAFSQVTFYKAFLKFKKKLCTYLLGLYFDFVYQIAFFWPYNNNNSFKNRLYVQKKVFSVSPTPRVYHTLPLFSICFFHLFVICFFLFFCKIKKGGNFRRENKRKIRGLYINTIITYIR